ncbi:hypothetical protein NUW54_g9814 [Trametes sanguinea]|uniref:Uncharacterized protein n=1 Tax=Trametes sanguinea TaxID=158606 RepID=A0ACC1P3A9_9APHY|nr:hypothetical protein NUW54_g9814 [Trametes sanguinea]
MFLPASPCAHGAARRYVPLSVLTVASYTNPLGRDRCWQGPALPRTSSTSSSGSGSSTTERGGQSRRRPPGSGNTHQFHGDESGYVNAQIGVLMLRKLDGVCQTVQSQTEAVKAMIESNQRFQEGVMALLQNLVGNAPAAMPAHSAASVGARAPKKTTPTEGSDRIVEQRIARVRGMPEAESVEEQRRRHLNRLKARVRNHIDTLLHHSDSSLLPIQFPTLTEEEVTAYSRGDWVPNEFRVDFVRPWKKFSLNKEARESAVTTFLLKVAGGAFLTNPTPEDLLTRETVGDMIDVYMKRLRRLYRKAQNPPSEERKDEIKRRACQVARMHTSYRDRRFVIIYYGQTRHKALFERMSAVNMSEDETDGESVEHPPVYRIVIAEWQSEELRQFLWTLDALYREYWAHA